MKPLY